MLWRQTGKQLNLRVTRDRWWAPKDVAGPFYSAMMDDVDQTLLFRGPICQAQNGYFHFSNDFSLQLRFICLVFSLNQYDKLTHFIKPCTMVMNDSLWDIILFRRCWLHLALFDEEFWEGALEICQHAGFFIICCTQFECYQECLQSI